MSYQKLQDIRIDNNPNMNYISRGSSGNNTDSYTMQACEKGTTSVSFNAQLGKKYNCIALARGSSSTYDKNFNISGSHDLLTDFIITWESTGLNTISIMKNDEISISFSINVTKPGTYKIPVTKINNLGATAILMAASVYTMNKLNFHSLSNNLPTAVFANYQDFEDKQVRDAVTAKAGFAGGGQPFCNIKGNAGNCCPISNDIENITSCRCTFQSGAQTCSIPTGAESSCELPGSNFPSVNC